MLVERRTIGLLVGTLLIASACGKGGGPAPSASAPAKVAPRPSETSLSTVTLAPEAEARLGIEVAIVERRAMPATITTAGEVIVPTGGSVVLLSPFAARVSAASAEAPKPGTSVTRGQELVKLSPLAPLDRDQRAQAERAVSASTAQLAAVNARVKRLEKLVAEGGASARQVEEAHAERSVLEADLAASTKRLAAIRSAPIEADVSIALRSPRDGLIRSVSVAPGQLVSAGAPLFEILGSPALWVRAALYAGEVARVPADAAARISSIGVGARGAAIVTALPVPAPPSADAASATVDLFYELPPGESRRPGERVTVTIPTSDRAEALVVPSSAVLFDAVGGAWVYVRTAEHSYERRRIDLARIEGDRAVLTRGPAPGALVVHVGGSELFGLEFGVGK